MTKRFAITSKDMVNMSITTSTEEIIRRNAATVGIFFDIKAVVVH